MKTIIVYYFKNHNKQAYFEWVAIVLNKQGIDYENTNIRMQPYNLIFLTQYAEEIVRQSFEDVLIVNANDFDNSTRAQREICALLIRTINKYCSYQTEDDLISFLASVFYSVLIKHYLNNGNKRIATALLFTLLSIFEMNIGDTDGKIINESTKAHIFEDQIADFVVLHNERQDIHKNMYKWLKSHICFLIND